MAPKQIVFANALAAAIAAGFYTVALVIFAVLDSSDYGRIERAGLQFDLSYFALYFLYFGLYLGFATALTKQSAVPARVAVGITVAIAVAPLGAAAFGLGYVFGALLFFVPGLLFAFVGGLPAALATSLVAVPLTGWGVGYVFNVLLAVFANWQKSISEVAEIGRKNVAVATACACLAAYLAYSQGSGNPPPLGWARVLEQIAVGLIGPLIHVASAVTLARKLQRGETRAPLGRRANMAALSMAACALVLLSAAAWTTHVRSGYQLWTAPGLTRVFAKAADVQQRRRPAPEQPIRIADYVVDARPDHLTESSYDWKTERFLYARFDLGSAEIESRSIGVTLDLTNNASQHGLGYVCDEPVEGKLSPCRVADFKKDLKDDPRVIRVGLYQGESEIGRIGHTFLMSCRYSFGICKIEFLQPWYQGVRVALIFDQKEREHWAAIVRFAIPEIERIVHRAP